MKRNSESSLNVNNNLIKIMRINNTDYISLTDLARYKNSENPGDVIIKWMSNKNSFDFYCLWEELFNENFKLADSREFKTYAATQSFTMSPSKWIKTVNATGFISKRGKYGGGTFAHPDIALEFASWVDPSFKLYLIKEFERLKAEDNKSNEIEWSVRRMLSKTNYRLHTESIKSNLVPILSEDQKHHIYANEADVINVALFGMTAKQWRINNPDLKGNIRDNTDILHLVVISNLEILNANMIDNNVPQKERIERLNIIAKKELDILVNDTNIIGIQKFIGNKD